MANVLADVQDGQDFIAGVSKGVTRRRAGARLAEGDYKGASSDLYGAGLIEEGAGVQRQADRQDDRATELADAEHAREVQEATRRVAFAKQVADSLGQIPLDQRNAAFDHVAPVFEQMGMSADDVQKMRAAPKDDNTLKAFGATLDDQLKLFSTRDGIVSVDHAGKANLAYAVTPDPLKDELTQARIEQAQASAARARRPPASRGSTAAPRPAGRVLGATLDPSDGW